MRRSNHLSYLFWVFSFVVAIFAAILPIAEAAPGDISFTNYTAADGLGESLVWGVQIDGGKIYAATNRGISIAAVGDSTFTNHRFDGDNDNMYAVSVVGSKIYSNSYVGIGISSDNGNTWSLSDSGIIGGAGGYWAVVYASGSNLYAGTNYSNGGASPLRKSSNGGATWSATSTGLGTATVAWIYAVGSTLYAATAGDGLGISTDGGATFTLKTVANSGLGNNVVYGVYAVGSTIYAATVGGGLSISTDGGTSFTNYTTANGLRTNDLNGVYVVGTTIYVASADGLSISTNGGTSFTNYTTANGLGDNRVNGVFVDGTTIYVATYGGLSVSHTPTNNVASVYVAPVPVPYLKTLTPPQLHLAAAKLVCTSGTYNSGYSLGGEIQGDSKVLYKPINLVYNLLVSGAVQTKLAQTSSATSVSWNLSDIPVNSTSTCSVTASVNSLTNTDTSSQNIAGLAEATSLQNSGINIANANYSIARSKNSASYQKALVDNRTAWRANVDKVRTDYYAELDRIKSLGLTKTTRALTSAALKTYITAQKKSATDYTASKPAALAAKDAADKAALDAKTAAIAKANAIYGNFIESIGFGVLTPMGF